MRHIPKSCRIPSVDAFPSKQTNRQKKKKLRIGMRAFHTFHNHLHTTHKTIHHTQGLCPSHPSLLLRQSIQSLEDGLYLALPQQLLREFLCGALYSATGSVCIMAYSLNRPCSICFVASASTESSSTIILTMTFVIIGVGGIVV